MGGYERGVWGGGVVVLGVAALEICLYIYMCMYLYIYIYR